MLFIRHPIAELYHTEYKRGEEIMRAMEELNENLMEEADELHFEEYGEYPESYEFEIEPEHLKIYKWMELCGYNSEEQFF